eukprot:COSAG05_NODE_6823_length_896_cov_7.531995_2_plen_90_part_00
MSSLEQLQEREAELRRLNDQLEKRKAAVIHNTGEAVSRRDSRRSSSDSLQMLGEGTEARASADSSLSAAADILGAGGADGDEDITQGVG